MKSYPQNWTTLAALIALAGGGGIAHATDPICFEAENVTTLEAPMEVGDGRAAPLPGATWLPVKEASGDRYLEIAQGKGNPPQETRGKATWTFSTTREGVFTLWMRVWWADECSNSLSVSIDGERDFAFGQDGTYKRWHWVKSPPRLQQLDLAPGRHTLTIKNREDGVRIDQVLLTIDRRYVPVGKEPVTFTPPSSTAPEQP